MFGFLCLMISFLMVLFSSYSFVRLLKPERVINTILYLVLIMISQIICSIEYLSIVKQVTPAELLLINFSVFLISILFWKYGKNPHFDFTEFKKIIKTIKQDKTLFFLFILCVYSGIISLFLALAAPSNAYDNLGYHIARIGFWIQNHTLAHYETSMVRQVIYSINSEIIMLWSMLFLKRDYLAILPQYLAYLGIIFLVYCYLKYLKISTKRILWTILILASLPEFIIEASSAQTNLIVGFLLFCSFYLFFYGVKENDKKSIIFSAISYSISLGTKYSAFFFVPVFGIIYLIISIKEKKKDFYKPVLLFLVSAIPAFLILSSYNYILNYIDFGNFFGPKPYLDKFSYSFSFKGFIANIIRYFMLMIDFTGIKYTDNIGIHYVQFKDLLFSLLGLKSSDGLSTTDITFMNTMTHENFSKLGLLGFIIFIPLVFKYSFKKLFSSGNRMFYIGLTGLFIIGFITMMSILMGFCYPNNRFLLSAFVLSAPIFALSYSRKSTVLKTIITIIAALNLLLIPLTINSREFFKVIKIYKGKDFVSARNEIRLSEDTDISYKMPYYYIVKYLGQIVPNNSKIALLFGDDEWYYPFFEENPSWKIYPLRYELLYKKKNYSDYDFIIIAGFYQDEDIIAKKLNYNYIMNGNKVIFIDRDKSKPKIFYVNPKLMPTISKNPYYQRNIIDFSDIPKNFILKEKYSIVEDYKIEGQKLKYSFFVYKKL